MNSPDVPGVFRSMCCQRDMMVTVVAEASVSNEMYSARFVDEAEIQAPLLLKQSINAGWAVSLNSRPRVTPAADELGTA
jgi:hypothetical protein